MPKVLHRLRINEVSSVDRGAGEGVRVILTKRQFSGDQRQHDAKTGAAMPDGSFPIENESDLHNAIRAVGRAKNPAAARAHIKARARALGLSHLIPEGWMSKGSFVERVKAALGFGDDNDMAKALDAASSALEAAINAALADDKMTKADRQAAVAKAFDDYAEHLNGSVPAAIEAALKAAGLEAPAHKRDGEGETDEERKAREAKARKDAAEAEDAKKALIAKVGAEHAAAVAKMTPAHVRFAEKLPEGERKAFMLMSDAQRADHMRGHALAGMGDGTDGHTDGTPNRMGKTMDLPADVKKQLEDLEAFKKRAEASEAALADLLKREEQTTLRKRCVEVGLPEAEAETIGKALKGDAAAVGKLLDTIKALNAQVKEAGLFSERGNTNGGGTGATANDQLLLKANEMAKAEKITVAQAYAKVYRDPANASLVKQIKAEEQRAA